MHSRTKFRVRYAETDCMGIVHHSNYPIWYEMGRGDYVKMLGFNYREMEEQGIMTPLLNLNCSFGKPALYDDEIILRKGNFNFCRKNYFFIHSKENRA